jgi:SAM-dependent methyltransferase
VVVAKRALSVGLPRLFARLTFNLFYLFGRTPWDTGVTPPELVQLVEVEGLGPGRALDLGCGTGTNAVYLARHSFRVTAVDFVARAIQAAEARARRANVQVDFRCADVLAPGPLAGAFDLILDIGCMHGLDPYGRVRYADNARKWTHQGSLLLIYAFFPHQVGSRMVGISRAEMENHFDPDFRLVNYADDGRSAWYRWERK